LKPVARLFRGVLMPLGIERGGKMIKINDLAKL
jgi:hypothetical protein